MPPKTRSTTQPTMDQLQQEVARLTDDLEAAALAAKQHSTATTAASAAQQAQVDQLQDALAKAKLDATATGTGSLAGGTT